MFLQSCSRPQAVRAHEKKSTHQVGLHTKIAQDIVQEGKLPQEVPQERTQESSDVQFSSYV